MNLFHSILRKSQNFDQILRNDSPLSFREISDFLDSVVDAANQTDNSEELDRILVIYRKWEAILFEIFGIQHKAETISTRVGYQSVPSVFVENQLPEMVFEKDNSADVLLVALSNNIEPDSTFYAINLKAIDAPFYKKKETFDCLVKATKAFKRSDLLNARSKFNQVITRYMAQSKLSSTELYFFSWALHGMGNIYLVLDECDRALELFRLSLDLKKKIPGIPSIFLFLTEFKFLITLGSKMGREEWNRKLEDFALTVYSNKQLCEDYPNFEANIHYSVGQSYLFLNQDDAAQVKFKRAASLFNQVDDYSGLLRSNIAQGVLASRPSVHAKNIENLFSNLHSRVLRDPYIQHLGGRNSRMELEMLAGPYASKILQIFKAFKIRGFDRIKVKF
jgi:tetratricopeptide (TPR) repeat protein